MPLPADLATVGTVAWLDLTTPDVDVAASFYAHLLGWRLESADTPVGRYVVGSVGAGPVAGMMAPEAAGGPAPAWVPFFGVADAADALERAGDLGATALQPPTQVPSGARIAVVADPAGAVVGLIEPSGGPAPARGVTGAVAWVEIQTRDPAASEAFYTVLMGWTAGPPADGYRVFERAGEPVAGLLAMPAAVPAEVPSYWLAYFGVADLDRACARVGELGGTVLVPVTTVSGMPFAVAEDPAGATFGLLHASP
ncbi:MULTISPECIES: VOC family protein [unclassified Blastococcus]|uniref:VOC family protein n=1 Tax=unclassified Blastococcus TaxID=2619396 RepID=UPI001EF012A5|nr:MULTISPECIES: VOC family protein [unclassified Blastococcus]